MEFVIGAIIVLTFAATAAYLVFWAARRRLERALNLALFSIILPKEASEEAGKEKNWKDAVAVMEQFFTGLLYFKEQDFFTRLLVGKPYFAFEMALPAIGEEIVFYFAAPRRFASAVEKQIHGVFPYAHIERIRDYNIFNSEGFHAGSQLRLAKNYTLPYLTYRETEADPVNAITNSLSKLEENGEGAAVQILVRPGVPESRRKRGLKIAKAMQEGKEFEPARRDVEDPFTIVLGEFGRSVARPKTAQQRERAQELPAYRRELKPMTPLQQELIKALEGKASKPFFDINIRLLASAHTQERAEQILGHLESSFAQFNAPQRNWFRSVRYRGKGALARLIYAFSFRLFDHAARATVNTEELASVFHFPIWTIEAPKVKYLKAKPAPPPADLPKEGMRIGKNVFRGADTQVRIGREDRRRHLYVVGQTGTGKTTFLRELIRQDIENGEGVGVIDPHGDLVEQVLGLVPRKRAEDVVYFDPADTEYPVGLNMLEWEKPAQKDFAVQEMIAIFMKLFPPEVIGPMFEHNMRNAMLTLMADRTDPGTIVEIPRIFTDDAFVRAKLAHVADPLVRAFWEKEMAKTTEFHKSEMLGYLISKVGRFIENEMMRNILGQPRSGFDFRKIMDEKRIFLANLSKGRVGEMNSSLLGLILVSKLQMAAMTRADIPEEERHDFYLYIDEFQNFTTDSVGTILSEARKYRLNLTIAHQFIAQLPDQIREAVFGNVGSAVSFRVGPNDAEFLQKQFAPVFNAQDLVNIDNFNAYVRLMVRGVTARPFNIEIYPPSPADAAFGAALRELSRTRLGRPRGEVEADIFERSRLAEREGPEQQFVPGERNM